MHLKHFRSKFKKLSEKRILNYSLADPASPNEITSVEKKLQVSFPEQVKLFYLSLNGLEVALPHLKVFSVEHLKFVDGNLLHFAIIDGENFLYFDTSFLNQANQWNIVSNEGFCVTLTMASFWSNKVWAWIESERKIWIREFETELFELH